MSALALALALAWHQPSCLAGGWGDEGFWRGGSSDADCCAGIRIDRSLTWQQGWQVAELATGLCDRLMTWQQGW